jgi:TonB family protein
MSSGKRPTFQKAFLCSFFIHLVLFFIFVLLPFVEVIKDNDIKNKESFIIVDIHELERFNKKLVNTEVGKEVKEAPKDAYLGEKNRVVEKESIRKGDLSFSVEKSSSQPEKSDHETQREEKTENISLSNLGVPLFSLKNDFANNKKSEAPRWVDSSKNQYHSIPSGEYIEGMKEGEVTSLNTKEYVFYSYFQRIRQQLDLSWKPILKETIYKRVRTGRYLSSDMALTTKTVVTLNKLGEVIRVQVIEESGAQDLDSIAIEAFNKAGPFPNPPKGLINNKGEIEVRWDFILRT